MTVRADIPTAANFTIAHLDGAITDSATTLDVLSGEGADMPACGSGDWFPAIICDEDTTTARENGEIVYVTARSTDALTIERGKEGTSEQAHSDGDLLIVTPTAQLVQQIHEFAERIDHILSYAWGGGDGIARGADDELEVVATSPVSLQVQVKSGVAFVSNRSYRLAAAATLDAITAPSANPRIDIVQVSPDQQTASIKTGTEGAVPSAPSADTDYIVLAEIYCRTGMTSIKDTDDSTNGYITDKRSTTGYL